MNSSDTPPVPAGLEWTGPPGRRTFTAIPPNPYKRKRIFGTETEFGTVFRMGLDMYRGRFLTNGGRQYLDLGHIEYSTPETTNPLSCLVYEKAGELAAKSWRWRLYKNTADSKGNTFASHENYLTNLAAGRYHLLLPFLLTRPIYAGAGQLTPQGEFRLSQRAQRFRAESDSTAWFMVDKDGSAPTGKRLELRVGEANMCEAALFLKLGATGLVLDLAEDGRLPINDYHAAYAFIDLRGVTAGLKEWQMPSRGEPAVDVQRRYLDAAAGAYEGRDLITDEILTRWDRTLDSLARHPEDLVGEVDWVTKKTLIDAHAGRHGLAQTDTQLRNLDLQYHDADRRTSIFYALQRKGATRRVATDKLIARAASHPPQDTRAFARGTLVRRSRFNPFVHIRPCPEWDGIIKYGIIPRYIRLKDPFSTYPRERWLSLLPL